MTWFISLSEARRIFQSTASEQRGEVGRATNDYKPGARASRTYRSFSAGGPRESH